VDEVLVAAREALLDTLEALKAHANSVVVIGAQAVHMRAPDAPTQVPAATSDVDLGLRVTVLADQPLIEEALQAAGFSADPGDRATAEPGSWRTPTGIHVDVMVPSAHAPGRRAARITPHDRSSARLAAGIEGIVVDADLLPVESLIPGSKRVIAAQVAGPAALLVAKVTKIAERVDAPTRRRTDKDAHDVYRLASVVEEDEWRRRLAAVMSDPDARHVAEQARLAFDELFGTATGAGIQMVERAEAAS